jgi:hypothetical protein
MYDAYTFDDGSGVKTIHCTDHGGHPNSHIHDEPGAGYTFYASSVKDSYGRSVGYLESRPIAGGHGRGCALTPYEMELLEASKE